MATLAQKSKDIEKTETLNISDLEKVNIHTDVETKTVNEGTPEAFSYDFMVIEGKEYRVPKSVQYDIQAMLKEYPDLTQIKVTKTGEGMKTKYHVYKVA